MRPKTIVNVTNPVSVQRLTTDVINGTHLISLVTVRMHKQLASLPVGSYEDNADWMDQMANRKLRVVVCRGQERYEGVLTKLRALVIANAVSLVGHLDLPDACKSIENKSCYISTDFSIKPGGTGIEEVGRIEFHIEQGAS